MGDAKDKTAREERLAAKLRENLRRRKAQSRQLDSRALESTDKAGLPEEESKS